MSMSRGLNTLTSATTSETTWVLKTEHVIFRFSPVCIKSGAVGKTEIAAASGWVTALYERHCSKSGFANVHTVKMITVDLWGAKTTYTSMFSTGINV